MPRNVVAFATVTFLAFTAPIPSRVIAQTPVGSIAWACPRHPDEVAAKEGKCSIDGLPLEPVHLDAEWTCPEHPAIAQDEPGTCPICKREFVKVEVTRYYTCPQSTLHELEPGNCADGENRVEVKHRRGSSAE